MAARTYVNYFKAVEARARKRHTRNGVLHISKVASLRPIAPNRKWVKARQCLRNQSYDSMAFILTFAIRSEYSAGHSRYIKLPGERTKLELAHQLGPSVFTIGKGFSGGGKIGVRLLQKKPRILVCL